MANTILNWNDENEGHLGFKLRKAALPYMDASSMTLVDTVGPAERTYTAPPGTGVQFWRIGAYDAEQETQSDKLALSFPVKIMTNDVLMSVMSALNTAGTGFGPYHPNGGTVGSWGGSAISTALFVTTAGGQTLAIDSAGIHEVKLVAGVPTLTKLADQLAGASTILWAVALPNGKVVYGCPSLGYAVFDPSNNSVALGLSRTSDLGNRGVYAHDIGKIILAGTTGNPGTDKLRFLILDPFTWTIQTHDVSGVTGGSGAYNGLLVVGTGRAHYWPANVSSVCTLNWDNEGVFTSFGATAPTYPGSNINNGQGLALDTGEFLAVGGGNAYIISATGVDVQPLSTYVGAAAGAFTDNVTIATRTPDGGFLFMGGGAAKFLYYSADKSTISVVTVPMTGGYWYNTMLDGNIYFFSSSSFISLTWENGVQPPINWPNNYLASQYNCQGRNPAA